MIALVLQKLEKRIIRNLNTSHTLNTFNDHSCNVLVERIIESTFVVQWNKHDIVPGVKSRNEFWIISSCNGSGSPSVKSLFESNDFLAASYKRGQLQGILVCLGT